MNLEPSSVEATPPQPVNAQDDAFDDTYAWVGYESAQPLPPSLAEAALWPGDHVRSGD